MIETHNRILLVRPDERGARQLGNLLEPFGLQLETAPDIESVHKMDDLDSLLFVIIEPVGNIEAQAPAIGDLILRVQQAWFISLITAETAPYEDLLRLAGIKEFLPASIPPHQLASLLARYAEIYRLKEQNQRYRLMQECRTSYEYLIGSSLPMKALYRLIDQVSRAEAPVLVTGEKGSEFIEVARSIHERSDRCRGSFVVVDCEGVDHDDLEKQIFGPVGDGSYSEGPCPESSAFARAGKGTIVINRIEFSSHAIQRRLLNFLRNPYFQDETSATPQPIARVVATAGPTLEEKVEAGEFGRELYYRLNILHSKIPPLRERKEDIPLLVDHTLQQISAETGKKSAPLSLTGDAMIELFKYGWPLNLDELTRTVTDAARNTSTEEIGIEQLPAELIGAAVAEDNVGKVTASVPMKQAKRLFEAEYFKDLLRRTKGNMTLASRISRVGRPYLYKKLKEHEIDPDGFRKS